MEKAPFLRKSPTRKQTHESKPTKVNKTQSTLSVRLVTEKRKPQRLPQTPCDRARGDGSGKPEAPRTRGAGERGSSRRVGAALSPVLSVPVTSWTSITYATKLNVADRGTEDAFY